MDITKLWKDYGIHQRKKEKSHLQFTDMEFLSDDNNLLPPRAPPNGKVCLSLLQTESVSWVFKLPL